MEEEFFAAIKLTTGEELIAKVCYMNEEDTLENISSPDLNFIVA